MNFEGMKVKECTNIQKILNNSIFRYDKKGKNKKIDFFI